MAGILGVKGEKMKPKLVIVDDLEGIRKKIEVALESEWEIVASVESADEALEACAQHRPDFVLLDLVMPKVSGLQFLKKMKMLEKQPKVVVMSSIREESVVIEVMQNGAIEYLLKPFDMEKLKHVLDFYIDEEEAA